MSKKSNLSTFVIKFDDAKDSQRNTQISNDFDSLKKASVLEAFLPIECKATKFYTKKIFAIVQSELYDSVYSCPPNPISIVEGHDVCIVLEQSLGEYGENQSMFFKQFSKVDHNRKVNEFEFRSEIVIF